MQVVHRVPTGLVDKLALYTVKVMRTGFDVLSGYKLKNWRGTLSEKCVQNRYLIAIVPCRSSPYYLRRPAQCTVLLAYSALKINRLKTALCRPHTL